MGSLSLPISVIKMEIKAQAVRVLKFAGKFLQIAFAVVGMLTVGLILSLTFTLSSLLPDDLFEDETIAVEEGSWISFDLDHGFKAGGELSTKELVALNQAALDDRIEGLFVKGSVSGLGLTAIQELTTAAEKFRDKKTRLVLDQVNASLNSLYLMQAFQEVVVPPASRLVINSPSVELPFFGDFLEEWHVKASFSKTGPYKAAPDAFTEPKMTSYQRENLSTLLDGIKEQISTHLESGTRISSEEMESVEKKIIISSEEMMDLGWVDSLRYMWQEDEENTDHHVPVMHYYQGIVEDVVVDQSTGVGILHFSGEIGDGINNFVNDLDSFRHNEEVKSILIQVSSPGGSLYHSLLLGDLIREINEEKPVVISSGSFLASGGYLMSTGASYISVNPMSIVGSIGGYAGKFALEGFFESIGIRWNNVGGPSYYSEIFDFNKDQKKAQDSYIYDTWRLFTKRVAEDRGVDLDRIGFIATGAVWTGKYSLDQDQGIVDSTGGLETALNKAVELGGGGDFYLIEVEKDEKDLLEVLLAEIIDESIEKRLEKMQREIPSVVHETIKEIVSPRFELK